ncbi:hypothetical protein Taro_031306 [Colocasia esculenta]|uniref:Uncharacterized protein n=1 Tax=Colocasia esculenta TaxID=4460 RepID=A0A843VUB1_COLES|nr:hypothetical protein [Colocasia esculenta]
MKKIESRGNNESFASVCHAQRKKDSLAGRRVRILNFSGEVVVSGILMSDDNDNVVMGKKLGGEYYEVSILIAHDPTASFGCSVRVVASAKKRRTYDKVTLDNLLADHLCPANCCRCRRHRREREIEMEVTTAFSLDFPINALLDEKLHAGGPIPPRRPLIS